MAGGADLTAQARKLRARLVISLGSFPADDTRKLSLGFAQLVLAPSRKGDPLRKPGKSVFYPQGTLFRAPPDTSTQRAGRSQRGVRQSDWNMPDRNKPDRASTSEHQRDTASTSTAETTGPGSGAILGGVLLMGAAAGYALIALRFKNMHAGTRGSGSAEVGHGTPAPVHHSCTSAPRPRVVHHLCAPLQMRAANIFSDQATRAANANWTVEARAAARAAETEAAAAACRFVAPPPPPPPLWAVTAKTLVSEGCSPPKKKSARRHIDAPWQPMAPPPAVPSLGHWRCHLDEISWPC